MSEKYEKILASIAGDSIASVGGVSPPVESKRHRNVQAYIFNDNHATVDININIDYGYSVKDVAYNIQTTVKKNIESRTNYIVDNINVNIIGVIMPIS